MFRYFAPRFTALMLLLAAVADTEAGTLDHFTFDTIPSSAVAGSAFATQITARDSGGNTVTTFNGGVSLAATSALSPIVVTEVAPGNERQFEIQNISNATVNTTGWFVRINDTSNTTSPAVSDMNAMNATTFSLPSSMTAGQTLRVTSSSTNTANGRVYFGSSIAWSNVPNKRYGWVAVFDGTSTLRDVFMWGWTAAYTAQFGVTVNSQAITLTNQWSGAGTASGTGAPGAVNVDSFQRTGTADNNTTADWSWKHNSDNSDATSLGSTNTGLTIPFAATGAASFTVTPSSVTMTSGIFSGNLIIAPAATLVTMTANDGTGHTGTSSTFTVSAPPPLTITTTSTLNLGVTGTAFSQTLSATGGSGTYSWSVSSGTLPASLTLSSTGVLSGTPTVAGTYNFTAQVTDSTDSTAAQSYTITISAPSNLTITTTSPLTAAYLGTSYSQALSASSGTAPYTWTLNSGALPGGLTLSSAGVLSGTPTAAGLFTFAVQVADSANGITTKTLSLEVFLATAANGIGIPHPSDTTTYTVTDGANTVQVPTGMVYVPSSSFTYGPSTTTPVIAASTVTLKGYCIGRYHVTNAEFLAFINDTGATQYIPNTGVTPTAYWVGGTYPAGRGNHPVNFVSLSAARAYATWVSQKTGFKVILPTAYQWEKAARGPNGYKYPWGSTAGATYSGGILTANFNFNANVTSYYLNTLNTAYLLTPAWTSSSAVLFNSSSSPYYNNPASVYYPSPMTVGSIVTISNASPPVAALLSISSSGAVSGYVDHNTNTGFIYTDLFAAINNAGGYTTPVGTYTGGVSGYGAYDMAGNLWNWTTTLFTASNGAEAGLSVNQVRGGSWYATSSSCVGVDSGEGRADGNYNSVGFRIAMILPSTTNDLVMTSASATEAVISTSYSQTLAATGDTAPYNWTLSSGTLPTGLALTPDGVLSGTPTALGTSTFTVQVTGSGGQAITNSISMSIVNPLSITTTTPLAGGAVGKASTLTFAATGGVAAYTWNVISGSLPGGLSLSSAGVLSGTPGAAGTSTFTVQVTDSGGLTATSSCSLTIISAYSNWAASFGLTGANSGTSASYMNDGIANVLKYAFGTSPVVSGMNVLQVSGSTVLAHGAPVLQFGSGGPVAVFCQRDDHLATGLTYTVQFSADLSSWTNSADTPAVLADDGTVQLVSVAFPALVNGQVPKFFRVSVTAP